MVTWQKTRDSPKTKKKKRRASLSISIQCCSEVCSQQDQQAKKWNCTTLCWQRRSEGAFPSVIHESKWFKIKNKNPVVFLHTDGNRSESEIRQRLPECCSTENNTKEQIQQKEGMIGTMKTSEFWKQHEHLKTDMVESNFSLWIGKPRIVKMR